MTTRSIWMILPLLFTVLAIIFPGKRLLEVAVLLLCFIIALGMRG